MENGGEQRSPVHQTAERLLKVARKFDPGCTVAAVVKSSSSTIYKLDPSDDLGTASTMATLGALRLAFPFAHVTCVEAFVSGSVQFNVVVVTDNAQFEAAKLHVRELKGLRFLRGISNMFFVLGLSAYATLLHAAIERP